MSIRSDEGLTLEMSAFNFLYGGQCSIPNKLINSLLSIKGFSFQPEINPNEDSNASVETLGLES